MKWTHKCSICGEKKDDYFVTLAKKKGAFGGGVCCLKCLRQMLDKLE